MWPLAFRPIQRCGVTAASAALDHCASFILRHVFALACVVSSILRRPFGLASELRSFMLCGFSRDFSFSPANVLGVSCAAGPACRSCSGAAVAAEELRSHDWRTATAVTPSRWRYCRQLGCRAEAGPHQLHTKVSRRSSTDKCIANLWTSS